MKRLEADSLHKGCRFTAQRRLSVRVLLLTLRLGSEIRLFDADTVRYCDCDCLHVSRREADGHNSVSLLTSSQPFGTIISIRLQDITTYRSISDGGTAQSRTVPLPPQLHSRPLISLLEILNIATERVGNWSRGITDRFSLESVAIRTFIVHVHSCCSTSACSHLHEHLEANVQVHVH